MARLSPSRRRQRSVRVTVAVLLLSLATVGVVVALGLATVAALSVSSVLALLSGWAAARIVWTELAQTRRAQARDRAAQARDFRDLFVSRSAEHAAFASAMTDRLAARDREVRDLGGTLRLSEARASAAEDRLRREARRLVAAQQRVAELEDALTIRRAEEADELACWSASTPDTVPDLLAWEVRSQPAPLEPRRQHA